MVRCKVDEHILTHHNHSKSIVCCRVHFWHCTFLKKWSESHSVVSDSLWPHGLYSTWDSPDQNTGVGSLSLLQGIFPTQGSNSGLPHCRQTLYQLSHKRSPRILEGVAFPFSGRSSPPRNQTRVSCIAGRFFTNWAIREAPSNKDVRWPSLQWPSRPDREVTPHGRYSPWNSPGQNTGVGSCSLLQWIFPNHGSNPGLPHCKWILY